MDVSAYFNGRLDFQQHRLLHQKLPGAVAEASHLRLEQLDPSSAVSEQFIDQCIDVDLLLFLSTLHQKIQRMAEIIFLQKPKIHTLTASFSCVGGFIFAGFQNVTSAGKSRKKGSNSDVSARKLYENWKISYQKHAGGVAMKWVEKWVKIRQRLLSGCVSISTWALIEVWS